MIPTNLPAPDELRLTPVDLPNVTIAIPATLGPSRDDDRYRFRLHLIEEDAPTREALCEIIALRARGVACLVSFGDRPLGRCAVELLAAPEYVFPDEYRFELVLHRKKLPPASSEKDRSDGQAEERPLAPVRASLSMLPRAIAHFHELSRRLLADRSALASTDPGQGVKA